jgi:dATP pyrophosphohydrolase
MQGAEDPPPPAGVAATPAVRLRRPESVLIVIYTSSNEFLLIERVKPPGFWQSVTGSLEWGEVADDAARREVLEETGIRDGTLRNLHWTQTYEISPSFGRTYASGVTHNLEHAFALKLPEPCPVDLSPQEHARFRWLAAGDALALVSSHTNRAVIEYLKR